MEEKFKQVIDEFKKITKKDCYEISIIGEATDILEDKIGGKPYLPIGEEYPKDKSGDYMPLLLQVNLKNIDLEGYPKEGILEIFTDKNLNWPCEYAVKYYKEGLEYQKDLPEIDLSNYILQDSLKIELKKDFCYMPVNDYRFANVMCPIVNKLYGTNLKNYGELDDFFGEFDWFNVFNDNMKYIPIIFGGYADFTQSDPRQNYTENKDECLFKLDSIADLNKIMLGDSGILFTLISKADIESKHFGNAIVDWDCC